VCSWRAAGAVGDQSGSWVASVELHGEERGCIGRSPAGEVTGRRLEGWWTAGPPQLLAVSASQEEAYYCVGRSPARLNCGAQEDFISISPTWESIKHLLQPNQHAGCSHSSPALLLCLCLCPPPSFCPPFFFVVGRPLLGPGPSCRRRNPALTILSFAHAESVSFVLSLTIITLFIAWISMKVHLPPA
jgi:hypothetical protein